MSYNLQAIRKTPMRELLPVHHFILEVSKYMTGIRAAANEVRLASPDLRQYKQPFLTYLEGRLHGYIFGMSAMLIYSGGHDIAYQYGDAVITEAKFLTGAYQHPEADQ